MDWGLGAGNVLLQRRVGLLAAFLILLMSAVWAASQIAGGIEYRSFQEQIRSGDASLLNTPVIAQSFRSPDANLHRIEIELNGAIPQTLPQDTRADLLLGDGLSGQPVYEAPLSAASVISSAGESYLSIPFPAQSDSEGKTYTVVLATPGYPIRSVMQPGYSPVDALSPGQLYTAGGAQPGDLAISAYYSYTIPSLLADIANVLESHLLLIIAWLLLMVLPGMALLLWLPNDLSLGQRLLASPAVMALSLPILLLLGSLLGFTFSTGRLWVLLALSAIAIGLRAFLAFRWKKPRVAIYSADVAFWGALGIILLLTTITRLLSLRGMFAGVGMDAYHHTLMSDLFVRDGGIPHSYEPFAPLQSFTYHFGFHSLVAALSWLSGQKSATDLMTLMPQVGQFASSVLPVPSLTLFAWKIVGNRWWGLTAGGLVGLVSVLPAYYVEWSRFTEGQALALLPVSLLLLLGSTEYRASNNNSKLNTQDSKLQYVPLAVIGARPGHPRGVPLRTVPLAVIGAAGLFLTHYRIAILYAVLVALYLLWRYAEALRGSSGAARFRAPLAATVRVAIVGVCSIIVVSPWLLNLADNFVKNFIDTDVTGIDVYFATAERLSVNVLNHPSLPILAALSAIAVTMLGWNETNNRRVGLAVGAGAGLLGLVGALYLYFNSTPAQMEKDLQFLIIGLSPVTWFLLLEIVAVAVLVWLAKPRGAMLLLPVLTWLVLGLWSSPQLLPFRLPFVGYLDAVTLASAAWLPASLLSGYAIVNIVARLVGLTTGDERSGQWAVGSGQGVMRNRRSSSVVGRPSSVVGVLAGLCLLIIGLGSGLSLVPVHDRQLYIAEPDLDALVWMRDNLPANSYVLANTFSFPWSPDQVLGLDSGLWVPLLSGVRSSAQPIPAYNEQPEDPNYFAKVRALVPTLPLTDDPAPWKALKAEGITHIYIGTRAADMGFSAQQLLQNKNVTLIYHKDAVWLFKII